MIVSIDELRRSRAREIALRDYGVVLTALACDLIMLYVSYGWKTSAAVRAVARNWTGTK